MKDSATGGLLVFIIAAPVIVVCCGGKAALIGAAIFGTTGLLTGHDVLFAVLLATLGGIVFLTGRSFLRARKGTRKFRKGN